MIIGFKKFTDWQTVADMAFRCLKQIRWRAYWNKMESILDLNNSRRRISNETETKLRIVAPKAIFAIY